MAHLSSFFNYIIERKKKKFRLSVSAARKTFGAQKDTVNFMPQKMIVEFEKGHEPAGGMLWRILAATVLLLGLQALGASAFDLLGSSGCWLRLALYLADYLVIGYDILRKEYQGIRNGQVFDENFLMAVTTLGALALAVHENVDCLESMWCSQEKKCPSAARWWREPLL